MTRRPLLSVVAASGVLLALALPALGLTTGTGALRQLPGGHEAHAGYAAPRRSAAPGAARRAGARAPRAGRVSRTLAADPEIARVAPPGGARRPLGPARRPAALRRRVPGRPRPWSSGCAGRCPPRRVGGVTAAQEDLTDLITGSMWKIALFLLGLSYLVLLVLLRSVVLPLKAVLMTLLSVGASYGVLALVFGTVATLTLPLVLAVVFGLSMDYEVFLLSRIRERYAATGDTTPAVARAWRRARGRSPRRR